MVSEKKAAAAIARLLVEDPEYRRVLTARLEARTGDPAVVQCLIAYARDRQATSFPLIVAAEQGGIKDVNTDHGTTRLVVVGDSLCLDNEIIDTVPGNAYFAALAANWLLDRPQVLLQGLGPRPLKEYKLIMTGSQRQSVQWLLLAGMPGAILLLGGLVWLRRRR